ncbi:MAG: hypothetical protein JWP75_1963 [Frondihabitans sp.]|nr:hypothetical protein [Frondihabitans sp.]
MRYVIIGAGAIGGTLGGRLAQHSPHPPLLIARGDHGAAIAANGLRLRSPDDDTVVRVSVASNPADVTLLDDDVLVFATKTQQIEDAVLQWVDQPVVSASSSLLVGTAGDLLPVFTALNGIESERIALRYFRRVFGICVWLPAVHLTAGEVAVRIAPTSGTFIIGRYGARADASDRALLTTLAADWEASTFRVFVVDDVMPWKHRKLLANLGNAVQALLGPSFSPSLMPRIRAEAEETFRTAGITMPSDADEEEWRGDVFSTRPIPGLEGSLGGSSWQSLQRGAGSIETDFLNGEIALLARSQGRDAPLNATVQRLARQASAKGTGAGSMAEAELTAELDAALRP